MSDWKHKEIHVITDVWTEEAEKLKFAQLDKNQNQTENFRNDFYHWFSKMKFKWGNERSSRRTLSRADRVSFCSEAPGISKCEELMRKAMNGMGFGGDGHICHSAMHQDA